MAEDYDNLKDLIDANQSLQARLEAIARQKQQLSSAVKSARPVLLKPVLSREPSSNSYANVKSKLDPSNATLQIKTQEEVNKLKRLELEMKECSFRPQINSKSSEIVQSNVYVPIYERPAPERKVVAESARELEQSEVVAEEAGQKARRKADPEFYRRQLEWERRREEKANNERMQKQLSEHSELYAAPKINKETSERIIGDQSDFMERLKVQEERMRRKREALESKYNDCTFRPKINSKSQNVPSRVFQQLKKEQSDDD